ncbi:phosphatase PAP2 family protein [bacterium]|nr:phosphatase PAP2 family protein [bacterium]
MKEQNKSLDKSHHTQLHFKTGWIIVYVVVLLLFLGVGVCASSFASVNLITPVDKSIPLIPEFVWIYISFYGLPLFPIFLRTEDVSIVAGSISLGLCSIVAFVLYIAVPVHLESTSLGNSISEQVLAIIYSLDFRPSANKLPSMHSLIAWTVLLMYWQRRELTLFNSLHLLYTILVSASTLFVKQHLLVDVISAVFLSMALWVPSKLIAQAYISSLSIKRTA